MKENKWSFSKFNRQNKITDVFGCEIKAYNLTPGEAIVPLIPEEVLVISLQRARRLPAFTEQTIREGFIFPVLMEIFEHYQDKITLFTGEAWSVADEKTPLNGFCDYLIGGEAQMGSPKTPMICVVEAKLQDFESGTWQCTAELYACKLNNERENKPYSFYFGCITTGDGWRFIKLDCENNLLIRDTFTYTLGNLPQLLGVWKWVLDLQLAAAPKNTTEK